MDSSFQEGQVVICGSTQAGTITGKDGSNLWILLNNGDIWVGPYHQCRYPQDEADLAAAPLNVDRLESKRVIKE